MSTANPTLHEKLWSLARNFWWCWQPEVVEIFRDLDPVRWEQLDHNPVLLLDEFAPEELEQRARLELLHSRVNYAYRRWQEYMESRATWADEEAGVFGNYPAAYFSAEFGVHESLPNYSGGLGVLAGDHLKSASDLGLPLVAVGLFYHEGYFSQLIDETGWQQEVYSHVRNEQLPIRIARLANGEVAVVRVDTRHGPIYAQAWQVDVGRVKLFLLDVNIEQNSPEDRKLTARLYGGDQRTRIRQEIVLGIGGAKLLTALGYRPAVVHMNEGHSAFAPLEFIRLRMEEEGLTFNDALREVSATCCFTTHTPVPAGHDRFDYGLFEEHLGPIADQLGIGPVGLVGMGRIDPQNAHEPFCMTVLAFKCSRRANGVSNLHGVVSRRMWASLWPWCSEEKVPIGHITNGVHLPSWLAPQMRQLYSRVLPANWVKHSGEQKTWANFDSLSDGEFWETHGLLKIRLIAFVRDRMLRRAKRLDLGESEIAAINQCLDPNALTIGFARRFAPYKRADLILRDIERFAEMVHDAKRPVQILFAGKSHPADQNGKSILQRIYKLTEEPGFRGRVVLVEDYDINLARALVQGVDVWLNNPRRPLEASGTSGQKVVLNGGLNCSILDGWWAEAYDGLNGFAIGTNRVHANQEIQDDRDAKAVMEALRDEVIPLYFERDQDGLPTAWISRMKRSVRTMAWKFNSDRMVMDYATKSYLTCAGGTYAEMDRFA